MKPDTRIRRLAVAGVAIAAVLVAGITGLAITKPATAPIPKAARTDTASEPLPPVRTASRPESERPRPDERGAEFARQIADTVFTWDTTVTTRAEVSDRLIAIADEHEVNGLAADLDAFLPTEATWTQLRDMQVVQSLEIADVAVPDSWSRIIVENPEAISPHTLAYNVTGIRRREGTVNGKSETFEAPISFTVFAACTAEGIDCWLLRLSAPDNPLA